MKYLLFAFSLLVIASCQSKDETTVIGTWKLTHSKIDIGDGNGKFRAVESSKKITFSDDGKVSSNGSICTMQDNAGSLSSGTYAHNLITAESCETPDKQVRYRLEGPYLVLSYTCTEPCEHRYLRDK